MAFPSVTEILSPWTKFDAIRPDVLQAAAERGTEVHRLCGMISQGDYPIVPGELKGYVASFRKWFDLVVDEVLINEERIVEDSFSFHGQPDLVIKAKHGETILVDIKTPISKTKTWRLQMAAYTHLVEKFRGIKIDRAGSLRLSKEGKVPKMDYYEHNKGADFTAFLSCLNTYMFFNSK